MFRGNDTKVWHAIGFINEYSPKEPFGADST